ncbi:MAG: tetratricopeptide repeat protein, partial [Proteobacteria bacterium]|nr:tetratricopeptide repeat protein [Pseudomonadota bacterium]
NIYLREKNIIRRLASSKTLLAISLACINLGLEDMASELLLEADTVFPDKEKPNELLFYLGKYLVKNGQQEKGLKSLDTLTSQGQSGEFVAKAYHIKGILLEENKKHERAIEMYSQALKSNPEVEDRIMILADKALVLAESGLNIESLQTAQEAKEILARYPKQKQFVYQKVGEICLALGKPEDALSLFNNAIAAKKDDNENMKLRFLIAQCYEALNRKNDYIDAYNQLTKSADPLWSRLAKEKMEAIIFKELLSKTEFNKYRR